MNGASSARGTDASPSFGHMILFWASFFTLIAAGIGFSVRGAILKDWGQQFGFTQSELGTITGGGLLGFGLAIIFFSFFADLFGYGKLMLVAFLLHASSAVVTFAATPIFNMYGKEGAYWCLSIGMWLFALGNGTCEAVINPLTATLFPKRKTHWLNILHAGWPLGLILGAVIVLGFNQAGGSIRWEYKLAVFLIPVLLYGLMMFNRAFPRSEASSSGVSTFTMVITLLSPILLFLFLMQALVGFVELGTDSWITNITERVLENQDLALLAFIWTNVLMFTLRFFAGPIVHKINPIGLLFLSACLGAAGLWLLGQDFTNSMWPWMAAVTVYGIGKTFYWPTLLGVISERYPKGGALALGISGGIGMISAGLLGGPGIGYEQDKYAVEKLQSISKPTYDRYMARNKDGEPDYGRFPVVTQVVPDFAPPVAGLDNAKLKVFDDWSSITDPNGVRLPDKKMTFEVDLEKLEEQKRSNKTVEAELERSLLKLKGWWETEGLPNYQTDKEPLSESRLYGAKHALLFTAYVPVILAVGFLLLIGYFLLTGGYKQVHLENEPPMGEY